MILNGNQRGGAKDLALHLMKTENERVELHELRGVLARDLMGALNEMYAVSKGTRCKQFLYSLSLNPPKGADVSIADFERAIKQAEKRLGLVGQPRAVVFHVKNGRRHCHVVWSRIRLESMKAVQMSHDREKLTALSRELFLEHGWEMPRGLEKRGERDPLNYTHAEYQQAQRIGKNARQIKAEIRDAWMQSDSRASLEAALAERGYILARGDRRDFVVIDRHGEVYSLPRFAGVKTKEVRARLGDGEGLPSVDEALAQLARERPAPELLPQEALARVTRHHAAFTRGMMERTLKYAIPTQSQRQETMDRILQSDEVVKIGTKNGSDVYTTREMIALERRMAETAKDMTRTDSHRVDKREVERAIDKLGWKLAKETNGKASLSEEQQQAFRHMASGKQMALVVGVAGAGKTTIMAGAKEALEAQGYRVRGAAPSGVAAAGLRDVGMQASTLHSLEARIRLAQQMMDENAGKPLTLKQRDFIRSSLFSHKDVLIVDEAGMVSAAQLARIIDLTKQSGAKLVLVGDPAQLQSIEAGAGFRSLLERNESVRLDEVRRQKTNWQRAATKHLSNGNIAGALRAYQMHGCISYGRSRDEAKQQLVADVMRAREKSPEQSCLVLAYTRQDVVHLNALIKAEMVKRGEVAAKDTEVNVTAREEDGERTEKQGFAVGDRILFRENNRELGVMNGTFGTLESAAQNEFRVRLDNGKTVAFCPDEYNRFQLGYAATVHKSQGVTVDRAFVLATPHFDRHTTYVAMSRHKEQVKLYASARDFKTKARLYQSLGKTGGKLSTLDFTDTGQKEAAQASWQTRLKDSAVHLWQSLRKGRQDGQSAPAPKPAPPREDAAPPSPDHAFAGGSSPAAAPADPSALRQLRDEFMTHKCAQPPKQPQRDRAHHPGKVPTPER